VGRKTHAAPLACTLALFAASRLAAWWAGVHFDATPLASFWQIVDPTLLRTHLLQSIWYLHSQPPLYNLLLGIGLKLFGSHFDAAAHTCQIMIGITIAVSLYALLVVLGLRRWWSAALASVFATSPAMLLFENWLFYEYPVTVLLLLAALAFAWFERSPSAPRSAAVFAALAAACYMRATFQILLPLLVLGLMLATFRQARRAIVIGAVVPLVLVAALYVKNWAVFGTPTTSSWTGMNLMQVAYYGMSDAHKQDLVQRGILSPISAINPFGPLDAYAGLVPAPRPRGVPVLDDPTKPTSGVPNFNNIEYVTISQRYMHDFLRLLIHDPGVYFRGAETGVRIAAKPSSDYYFFTANRKRIHGWERVYDAVVFWQPRVRWTGGSDGGTSWAIVTDYLVALCFGAFETVRVLRQRGGQPLIAFMWLVMTYAVLAMSLGESAENQRIRFVTDPLATLIVAGLVIRLVPRLRRASQPLAIAAAEPLAAH
jgi:hypothetical protein